MERALRESGALITKLKDGIAAANDKQAFLSQEELEALVQVRGASVEGDRSSTHACECG